MEFKNILIIVLLTITLVGCKTTNNHATLRKPNPYEQGFRDGAKHNIEGIVEQLNGNDFPFAGTWSEPIVQDVVIPAHIKDGVFYPESKQTVLIVPGEWKKQQAFPIKSKQKENGQNENTLQNISVNAADITVLPQQYSGSEPQNGQE